MLANVKSIANKKMNRTDFRTAQTLVSGLKAKKAGSIPMIASQQPLTYPRQNPRLLLRLRLMQTFSGKQVIQFEYFLPRVK